MTRSFTKRLRRWRRQNIRRIQLLKKKMEADLSCGEEAELLRLQKLAAAKIGEVRTRDLRDVSELVHT